MEGLFPKTMNLLAETAKRIDDFTLSRSEVKWENQQWSDFTLSLSYLHTRLIQLNSIVKADYIFEDKLIIDIVNYTNLLVENRDALDEYIGFLLDKPQIFPGDSYTEHETLFLQEVLNGINDNCNDINALFDT